MPSNISCLGIMESLGITILNTQVRNLFLQHQSQAPDIIEYQVLFSARCLSKTAS